MTASIVSVPHSQPPRTCNLHNPDQNRRVCFVPREAMVALLVAVRAFSVVSFMAVLVVNGKAFTSCDLSGQTALMSGATGSGERYGMRIK